MKSESKNLYDVDFIYVPKGTEDFKSVHILLKIPADKLELHITSEEKVDNDDLAVILTSLQKNQFDKIRISLIEDVTVFVEMKNERYGISFQGNDIKQLRCIHIGQEDSNVFGSVN